MAGQDGYALGVDLGTSNTVAVLRWPDGRTRPLLFDGQPIMPSGVFLDGTGRLHVGRDAQRLAQADPAGYEPNPKRRIDEPGLLLGDAEVATVDLLAGLLRAVAQAAVEAVGFLPPTVLTYPATWGARRRDVLATAVGRAGWPPVEPVQPTGESDGPRGGGGGTRLVPEPVAAARYFTDVLRRPVPVGAALAVFDFGGGTLDIAVVRNEGVDRDGRARFAVIGSGGLAELGGLDLDAALVEHLGRLIGTAQPEAWQQLTHPTGTTGWRNRRQFWDDVRGAKEMLSRTTVAPVPVPGVEQAVHLTRDELERLATPLLRRGVFEAASVITNCRLTPDQLAGLFLVGGSSRVPLVARLLHAELGVAPTVLEQPELPVAEGALAEIVASLASAPVSAAPVSAAPVSAAPVSAAPVSPGQPVSAAPVASGQSVSAGPVSPAAVAYGQPVSARQPVTYGRPVAAGQASWPGAPGSQPAGEPSYPAGVARAGGWRNRRTLLIGAGAVLALLGVVTAAVLYLTGGGYRDIAFQSSFSEIGQGIPSTEVDPYYVSTALIGDRAYLAYEREDKRLEVIAAQASTGKQLWKFNTDGTSDRWAGITALPNALVILADEPSDADPHKLIVVDPANGKQLWDLEIRGNDSLRYFESMLVLVDRTGNQLRGLNPRTGRQEWHQDSPKDEAGYSSTAVYPVTTIEDLGGPASTSGRALLPVGGDKPQIVQIGADDSARVIDVNSGRVLKTATGVANYDDLVVAHDGRLYVAPNDGGYQVVTYDLEQMGTPVTLFKAADDKHRPDQLVPCGSERVCLLDKTSSDAKTNKLFALDAKERELWSKDVPDAEIIVPVGEHVLVRTTTSETSTIYAADGTKVIAKTGVGVRLDGGNLLLFADSLSTNVGDISVAGVRVRSKEPVELGELTGVKPASCSWNTSLIVCAGDSNFVFRRFAED